MPKRQSSGPYLLDPFAFPAETRGRFAMLITALVLFVMTIAGLIVVRPLAGYLELWVAASQEQGHLPVDSGRFGPTTAPTPGPPPDGPHQERLRERVPEMLSLAQVPLRLLGLVLLVAGGLYATHGIRLRRRLGGRQLDPEEAPELFALLRRLARRQGLDETFTVRCTPGHFALDGQAFGFKGREILHLPLDPAILAGPLDGTTRAIALHELAHLVNGDTQDRERSRALWLALMALCLFLVAATLSSRPPLSVILLGSYGFFGFLGVIHLLRRDVVRMRELYADWRVAAWGHGEALAGRLRLGAALRNTRTGRVSRWRARLADAGRTHPSHEDRLKALADPGVLFRVSNRLPFLTGMLLSLIAGYGPPAIGSLLPPYMALMVWADGNTDPPGLYVLGFFLTRLVIPGLLLGTLLVGLAYLVTRSLGVQVQRAAIARLATPGETGWGYLTLLRPTLLVGAGFEVGALFSPLLVSPYLTVRSLLLLPAWNLALAAGIGSWILFLHAGSRFFLGTHVGSRPPHWLRRSLEAAAVLLLSLVFWPLVFARAAIFAADALQAPPPEIVTFPAPHPSTNAFFTVGGCCSVILLGLLFVAFGMLLGAAVLRWLGQDRTCRHCGEPAGGPLPVGRFCRNCARPLAPWIYVGEPSAETPGDVP